MKNSALPAVGLQTFEDVLSRDAIYVDKTDILSRLIASPTKTWFLARPRRFGKSLTVSTLEAIFSGKKDLFQNLAIESRLDEKNFSPRPVIRMDMSMIDTTQGVEEFEKSLKAVTILKAEFLGIELSNDLTAVTLFSSLIQKCFMKYNTKVAVLIDEYDTPVTDLIDKPMEADAVREKLRKYYSQLKANDSFISFVFVTGVTKSISVGLYSSFNNPHDISLDVEYGALTGFTQNEIERYFQKEMEEVAVFQDIPLHVLVEKMKEYYNGFCFDSQTLVYNPFSLMLFFNKKHFSNFWFKTGTPEQLISFLKKNYFLIDDLRGVQVNRERIEDPSHNRDKDLVSYLFQLGYLSLRQNPSKDKFSLDFPNIEVRESMARRLLESYFESVQIAENMCDRFITALAKRDPALFIGELNRLLSKIPYDFYGSDKRDEGFYCSNIFTLLYSINLDPFAQKHGNFGRADFVISHLGQTWVIEVKIRPEGKDEKDLANQAISQIKEKNYSGGYLNPVLLGVVIDDKARAVTWWKCEGGTSSNPELTQKDN
jgi:hypothetical protein